MCPAHGGLDYPVGQAPHPPFLDPQQKKIQHPNPPFDPQGALGLFVNNHNNKIHTVTRYRPNALMQIRDGGVIQKVNDRITSYYEKARNWVREKELKIGAKAII